MAPELVVVQGLRDTRGTLERWNARPWATLGPWLGLALAICAALLASVVVIAHLSTPDPTNYVQPGVNVPPTLEAVGHILFRNALVLALHAMACVAGFIAGSSLPLEAERYSGVWRWVHDKAGPMAIAFVVAATTFSLFTQAYVLGGAASTMAFHWSMSPELLVVGILPHAIPELTGALPAAGRLDDRQPPRRLGGAAGRHLRDGRDRDPDGRHRRLHRGVRVAAPHPRAARLTPGTQRPSAYSRARSTDRCECAGSPSSGSSETSTSW